MPTAPNRSALKGRLDRFFWDNKSSEMTHLQATLAGHFGAFDRVAVVGGLVRDFAREGRSGFQSDVDLVIDAPAGSVAEVAERLGATPNRFGGYGSKAGPWKIDFWALETTWGRRYVPVDRLEDVVHCTFFDWDAVAYDLWNRKLISKEDYLERVSGGTLDINLLPNPSPMGNLVRAVRRIVLWHVRPGPQLRGFIEDHLDDEALRFVQTKEVELFRHNCVSLGWNTAAAARYALLSSEDGCEPKQLALPLHGQGSAAAESTETPV